MSENIRSYFSLRYALPGYTFLTILFLMNIEFLMNEFSYSIEIMKKHKVELENMLHANPNYPINVSGLFIHPIKILETDFNPEISEID